MLSEISLIISSLTAQSIQLPANWRLKIDPWLHSEKKLKEELLIEKKEYIFLA